MVGIKLKWNKNNYDNVHIDTNADVATLKKIIYDLTGVPTDRQKLMAKGSWVGVLKDDAVLSTLKIPEGQTIMLMGTAEVVEKPKEEIKFMEDMTVDELAVKGAIYPAGFVNLGNTCYLNSTIECLRYMPELRATLQDVNYQTINLATLLRDTFNDIDKSGKSTPPPMSFTRFIISLRSTFQQFAEANQHGFLQQDAEEFYNAITGVIKATISDSKFRSILGLELLEEISCEETDAEEKVISYEEVNKLVCNIQGGVGSGATINVDHMHEGLKLGLESKIEKFSTVLNRNALWSKKQRVSSLPRYLCIQFMRFFWKLTPESRDHTGNKCKILRPCSYPEVFDIYDFCTDQLQEKLKHNRIQAEKRFDSELATKRAVVLEGESNAKISSNQEMEVVDAVEDDEDAAALQEALKLSLGGNVSDSSVAMEGIKGSPTTQPVEKVFGNGIPDNFTGNYELYAIVTHKGRSADSGHYIGWVRQSPGSSYWWCYDDDKVSEKRTEDVMNLKGGGDWPIAYLNFYRYKEEA
eukprot:gene5030-7019_t